MRRLLVGGAALLIGASRFAFRGRVPDDYDSFGFVLALDRFDLARLQPHFPGYPVYVALGKIAHSFLPALTAAQCVSAVASSAMAIALYVIAERRGAGLSAILLYGGAWLPWMLGGSALSDETAGAFAALAFAFEDGLSIALMLGTRLSYWPIALAWLAIANRRAILVAAGGCIAWIVPFVLLVPNVISLGKKHIIGHFTSWGGSIATRPALGERLFSFGRDLFYDGIAPHGLALAAVALIFVIARPRWERALLLVAPYALWIFFAQNIVEQPRHALPLVLMLLVWMAWSLKLPWAVVASAVMIASSLPLAIARHHTLPAAAQAAASLPSGAIVFGGRSTRFFAHSYQRTWLSEVDVDLERMNRLPERVYITSEVTVDKQRSARVHDGPTFCRDARLDRQQPCLTLREYHR
jgi:hypothetical protein